MAQTQPARAYGMDSREDVLRRTIEDLHIHMHAESGGCIRGDGKYYVLLVCALSCLL